MSALLPTVLFAAIMQVFAQKPPLPPDPVMVEQARVDFGEWVRDDFIQVILSTPPVPGKRNERKFITEMPVGLEGFSSVLVRFNDDWSVDLFDGDDEEGGAYFGGLGRGGRGAS